jgi:hypothetical protein
VAVVEVAAASPTHVKCPSDYREPLKALLLVQTSACPTPSYPTNAFTFHNSNDLNALLPGQSDALSGLIFG